MERTSHSATEDENTCHVKKQIGKANLLQLRDSDVNYVYTELLKKMVHISIWVTLILFSIAPGHAQESDQFRSPTQKVLPSVDTMKNPATDLGSEMNRISELTLAYSNEVKQTTLTYISAKHPTATRLSRPTHSEKMGSEEDTYNGNSVWTQKWPFGYRLGFNSNRPRLRTLRTEKMSKDGVIEGELTFLSGNGISRGVRYTAQPGVQPLLLYRTLLQFLALAP